LKLRAAIVDGGERREACHRGINAEPLSRRKRDMFYGFGLVVFAATEKFVRD
jgi:hypothetical protein